MKEFKIACLIALSHLSKLLVHLFILKQIAVIHGPKGLGFLGNFMTLIALASTLAGGGIVSGIIKYISEYTGSIERQCDFIGSAFVYTIASSLVVLILGVCFVNSLTDYVFLNREFKGFIYFFLVVQIFIAANNFAFGVSNGYRKTGAYAIFVIGGNIIAFAIAYYAIPHYGFWGAIISIASPAFFAFIPLVIFTKIKRIQLRKYIQFQSLVHDSKLLSKYSLMLICSAICFPVVEMIIRNMIVQKLNLSDAGYWQAITRFSSSYLSFYSLLLSFYFVPLISASDDKKFIFEQVKKMILFILLLFIPMMGTFCILKNEMIQFIFSADFLPVADLCLLQMIGDLFRVVGWVIGFVIVAKALSGLYILSEIFQAAIFIVLSYLELSYSNGLEGVVFAYMSTCILYCLLSFMFFYYIFRSKQLVWVTG